ncbi:PH domain-containing protein [Luteimonas sp. A277]
MTTTPEPAAGATTLPTQEERRLHPASWLFVLVGNIKQFMVPLLALLIFGGRGEDSWQLMAAGVAAVVLVTAAVWRYFTWRYRIGEDSLFVRSGLLERSLRQIPFSRIHDVAVHQTLLHRVFQVAEVRLESASGDKPEAVMQVLQLDQALALERLIRRRGEAVSTAENAEQAQQGDTLLALSTAEVVRLGLISNRGMVVVAGAMAVAWQFLPDDDTAESMARLAREAFGHAGSLVPGWTGMVLGAVMIGLAALIALRALSVVLALVQYHDFRLEEHGRRLTVGRGLLTRRRNSVPRRRIQAWTLVETVTHRLFRLRSLRIDTAVIQRGNEERGLNELAPVATSERCDALVRHLVPQLQWPPQQWQPLHHRAWLRLALGGTVFAMVACTALCWRFGAWGLLALAWIPWSVFVARQHARRAGYCLHDELLAVREGWWSRHWRFAEVGKLQALQLRQGLLDRCLGMASLWLDTAGAGALSPPLRIRYLPEAEARALLQQLGPEVARRPLRW